MQVPQVTEEAALAVVEHYPTPFLLAQAYYVLVRPLPSSFPFVFISLRSSTVYHKKNTNTFLLITQNCIYNAVGWWHPCPGGDVEKRDRGGKCRSKPKYLQAFLWRWMEYSEIVSGWHNWLLCHRGGDLVSVFCVQFASALSYMFTCKAFVFWSKWCKRTLSFRVCNVASRYQDKS